MARGRHQPATEQWVAEQLAYTRGILDKLPGREQLHARLTQLLQIGNLGGAEIGGDYYFHTRREGTQNQPCFTSERASTAKTKFWSM